MIELGDVIAFLVACDSGRMNRPLSEMIYGTDRYRSAVNNECHRLDRAGIIIRRYEYQPDSRSISPFAFEYSPGPALSVVRNRSGRITDIFKEPIG